MKQERRLDNRYAIYSDEIQISVLPSRKTLFIKDISKGGLGIEYSPVGDEPVESELVDIIAVRYNRLNLLKIPCKTVYDIPILMHSKSFKGGEMRVRGLKFFELTKEQEDKLDILLKRCLDPSDL